MFILAIDQGTTGTKSILFDQNGKIVKSAYREFTQFYPKPGWVEHDPLEIWQTVVDTVQDLCSEYQGQIAAIGITNQRETTVVWDKITGKPVYNAIVWQCRRTIKICQDLSRYSNIFKSKTGLLVDAYFSGTKIRWILDQLDDDSSDQLLFGTIDTWLIWNLTRGKVHATDFTNASRTLLYNIVDKKWDEELSDLIGVPLSVLPEVKNSIDNYGTVESIDCLKDVPIYGVAGDQQAALFGQGCVEKGSVKNTYGTGCFAMMNIGSNFQLSQTGLLTTLAIDKNGNPCYALEGSIFIAGAVIQWLRDELNLIETAADSEAAAVRVEDNNGVYIVPAFVGLGAPHWDMDARGLITGLTRGVNRDHIIRAALESIAYQSYDVLAKMEDEMGIPIKELAVDGGAVVNDFLMQFQADILNRPVLRPAVTESTSLGAAYLAGLKAGFWENIDELKKLKEYDRTFYPEMNPVNRKKYIEGWEKALRQARMK
ncbi:MAG: glycerol kinase GlpK [Candidatus Marinimicrobia bacterium]|nr:glycerol kinase GlpK [Candidatus Neomarinimicrobiota bacterium]MBL7067550.1 glycerol kinase GlpK [Candidatus Neomarinimicrobiota bacterium]